MMNQIISEIGKVVKGKNDVVEKVLIALFAGGHILMEDEPGLGKTTLAKAVSKVLGLESGRIQFTPDTMPSDITGYMNYNEKERDFEFREGAVMCNLLLADEINRTSAKTQAALLEAMEERTVTVDSTTYSLPNPFAVIATQNPLTSGGTQPLPDSQLDRFMVRLSMGYPDVNAQMEMLMGTKQVELRQLMTVEQFVALQQDIQDVVLSGEVCEYIVKLCESTRHSQDIVTGVSCRGAKSLVNMCKSTAYFSGRNYIIPEDVEKVFVDVVSHRLVLSPKLRSGNVSQNDAAKRILESCQKPRLLHGVWNRKVAV